MACYKIAQKANETHSGHHFKTYALKLKNQTNCYICIWFFLVKRTGNKPTRNIHKVLFVTPYAYKVLMGCSRVQMLHKCFGTKSNLGFSQEDT